MKKQAIKQSVPDVYHLLSLPLDKKRASRKIVIDVSGKIHEFTDGSVPVPVEIVPDREWQNFDQFVELPKQTVLAYHEQFFGVEPPKKQSHTDTAVACWAYMVKEAKPHLPDTDPVTGKKERKSSLGTRRYFLGSRDRKTVVMPFQMSKCLDLLEASIPQNRDYVTEEELSQVVTNRAGELKTKQDPWRIFQYYRPRLIQEKLLRYE